MRCDDVREAISAAADGETNPLERKMVGAHLVRCPGCAAYATAIEQLDRTVRIRPAAPVPDLSASILRAGTRKAPRAPRAWPRYVLLWVALTELVLAIPALAGTERNASVHAAHELGSWEVALAVGLLVAAWQPRRAIGLLPFAMALAGAMVLTAGFDIVSGHVPAAGEAQHLLDLAGVGALWMLTRSTVSAWPKLGGRSLRTA